MKLDPTLRSSCADQNNELFNSDAQRYSRSKFINLLCLYSVCVSPSTVLPPGGADKHPEEVLSCDSRAQLHVSGEGRNVDKRAESDEHNDGTAQVL